LLIFVGQEEDAELQKIIDTMHKGKNERFSSRKQNVVSPGRRIRLISGPKIDAARGD